jgi:hypothetical protein
MKSTWTSCLSAAMLLCVAAAQGEEVKSPAGVMTPESTFETLTNLGYEPKLNANKKSNIQIDREGSILYYLISTVPESLMLRVTVASVTEDLELAAPGLQAFLKLNEKIAPALFQYDAKNRHVQLVTYIPNSGFTPARMRREIEAFDEIARSAKPLWNGDPFRRIQPNAGAATVAEFGRLEGAYELLEGSTLDGNPVSAEQRAMLKIRFTTSGEMRFEGKSEFVQLVLDPTVAPGAVDFVIGNGAPQFARYRVEGDMLSFHVAPPSADRPKTDATPAGKDTVLICRRVK